MARLVVLGSSLAMIGKFGIVIMNKYMSWGSTAYRQPGNDELLHL